MKQSRQLTTYGPYSPIMRAGSTFYVSGQVGVDPATGHAAADISNQTTQVIENLKNVLASENLSLQDVVKTTVYLRNMDDFKAFNTIYIERFEEPRPARACFAVADLPHLADTPLLVEIEAVAYRNQPPTTGGQRSRTL